jgi:hypothetical protein
MKYHELHNLASSVPIRPRAGYFKLGVWVRLGIASIWATLAGLAMLIDAKLGIPAYGALAVVIGGSAIGAFSWRQIRALDDTLDAPATVSTAAESATRAGESARTRLTPPVRRLSMLQR